MRFIGLPPLIGYLIAGFVINALGQTLDVTIESTQALQHITHLGVLLLLFTVAAKVLDSKGELRAFHGRVAIGILVVQDLLALGVMSVVSGQIPSLWALVVFGIPLLINWFELN